MTSDIQKWCRVGYYIDAKDNMNEWCIAEVRDLTKTTVKVMMNEWAPKWESFFPIKSSKIAPFRKNSKPNSTSKLRSCKSSEFSITTLVAIHEKLKLILNTSLLLEDAFNTTQFYRGKLFLYIENLFSSKPSPDYIEEVINFSLDLLKFFQKWLESCKGLFPYYYQGLANPDLYLEDNNVALAFAWGDFTEIFKRLVGIDSRYGDIFSYIDMPQEFCRNLGVCSGEKRSKWTKFFLEKFVDKGFDVILDIVQNEDEKSRVPFVFLNSFPVYEILELLDNPKYQEFSTVFNRALLKRLEIISESELKDLKHEEIISLLNRLKKFRVFEGHLNIEHLKLSFFLKMLRSAYLEKRIKGLIEINSVIESLENKWSYDTQKLKQSIDEVKNWLYHEDILKIILTDRPHIELIKRSSTVFKFFAKCQIMNKEEILQLWASVQNKHESYVRATYDVIIELASVLSEAQNDLLYAEFCGLDKEKYDEAFLAMVKEFSIKAICTGKNAGYQGNGVKVYGFEMFRQLIKENFNQELSSLGIKNLVGIVAEDICKQLKTEALELVESLIKNSASTYQGLVLFSKIIKKTEKNATVPADFLMIRKILSLAPIIINHLQSYLHRNPNTDETSPTKLGTTRKVILHHLKFLVQTIERSPECITQQNLNSLWSMFESRPSFDRVIFFNWLSHFTRLRTSSISQLVTYIFRSLFLNNDKFPHKCNSFDEFLSFFHYFLEYNRAQNNLDITEQRHVKYRKNKKVKGLDKLVNIFIHTEDEIVMEKAGRFIYALMSRFDIYVLNSANEIIDELVSFLMNLIEKLKDNERLVLRILVLFQILLDKCDEDPLYNYSLYIKRPNAREYTQMKINQYKTIRHIRKEISKSFSHPLETVAFMSNERKFTVSEDDVEINKFRISYIEVFLLPKQMVTEYLPFDTISENQDFINLLFDLVSDTTKHYTDLAWKLLLSLPTCKRLKYSVLQLKLPIKELIDTSSTYKLLYTLKIILKNSQNKSWVDKFRAVEGVNFIISVFVDNKKELPIKLRAIKEAVIIQVLANTIESIPNPTQLIAALFRSFKIVAKAVAAGEKCEYQKQYFESLKTLISFVSQCRPEAFSEYLESNPVTKHVKYSLIQPYCPSFCEYSECISHYSFKVFKKIKKIENCHEHLYAQCLDLIDFAFVHATKCGAFWDLLNTLIQDSENLETTSKIAPFLLDKLEGYSAEVSSTQKDEVLCGIMKILKASIAKVPMEVTHAQFFLILNKCLCEIPENSNNSQVPKCKHPETRLNGFLLVLQLLKQDPRLISQMSRTLDRFHEDPSWRTSKKSAWIHTNIAKEKSFTGYVGIKNLGCTCYMGSVLQQLFMIPSFRQAILNTQCAPDNESLLYQLQYIFAGLLASDKQAISPKYFAKAFKDPEGNEINVIEQMDVDEFFASLLDKLETCLKGSVSENLIKSHFGGIQATEIIGKECPHRSEREEPFISISVEVKNKKNLLEGLESYVAEEVLEGENAYQCDHCECKVKAIRRVCVKYLPNYLILALRRFEFDFDTMSREKVNDFFEFPLELSMEAFTQEGLEKGEQKEKDYYMYTLKGIVIHIGTAESGHYYSYISTEGKWVEFNDIWVGPVNPQNIPNDCFGGEEKVQYSLYNKASSREKVGNAYMLLYERKKMFKPLENGEDVLEEISLCKQSGEIRENLKIKKQNLKYWVSKIVFGQEYINFIVYVCKFDEIDPKFVVKFFLTILIRGREKMKEVFEVYARIEKELKADAELAAWLLDMISVESVSKELLIYNPLYYMRRLIVGLCKTALSVSDHATHKLFFCNLMQNLKLAKKKYSHHFAQYLELIKLSFFEISSVCDYDCATNIVNFVLNRPFSTPPPVPHQFQDIHLGYNGNSEENFKDDNIQTDPRGASVGHLFHLIYFLRLSLSETTKLQLKLPISLNHLINDANCPTACKYVGKLLSFLSANDKDLSFEILELLLNNLKNGENQLKFKIFTISFNFFKLTDEIMDDKILFFIEKLTSFIKSCKNICDIELLVSFLVLLHCKITKFHGVLVQYAEIFNALEVVISAQASVTRVNSLIIEDPIKNCLKNLMNKVESLKSPPLGQAFSDDEFHDKFVPGINVGIIEGSSPSEGKIIARAGDVLLIDLLYSSNESPEIRDLACEEVSLKSNLPL